MDDLCAFDGMNFVHIVVVFYAKFERVYAYAYCFKSCQFMYLPSVVNTLAYRVFW